MCLPQAMREPMGCCFCFSQGVIIQTRLCFCVLSSAVYHQFLQHTYHQAAGSWNGPYCNFGMF